MKTKAWPALAELAQALESKTARALNPAVFDAIADRLESALAASDNAELATVAARLEDIARQWMASGSDAVRMALRGDARADDDLVSLFVAGRLAFAQNLAARALDRRADDAFYDLIVDPRYKAYICALLSGAKTGTQLAEIVEETVETVSRKLKGLEEAGVVRRRKSGQATLNLLTPAARLYAENRRLSPMGGHVVQAAVQTALMARSEHMPDHLQASPVLGPEPMGAG
ncbi:MAG: helix-turn-helix transcriptional regulator [Brevundimonas sp.]|uniref:helix-turn-helix domain-containing protein n=1 Tax=Brevundimonas sp. TaxID=1871086 RepID=UPI0025BE0787|nr:helix-turn-helix domain-containing protein [Brevundimonas sp.]MBX3477316.1 helix-turn-helix transcriptional regulator [Brevundimonas sp.]